MRNENNRIAIEAFAKQIGKDGKFSPIKNKLCTKKRALESGCSITSDVPFPNNRLMKRNNLYYENQYKDYIIEWKPKTLKFYKNENNAEHIMVNLFMCYADDLSSTSTNYILTVLKVDHYSGISELRPLYDNRPGLNSKGNVEWLIKAKQLPNGRFPAGELCLAAINKVNQIENTIHKVGFFTIDIYYDNGKVVRDALYLPMADIVGVQKIVVNRNYNYRNYNYTKVK